MGHLLLSPASHSFPKYSLGRGNDGPDPSTGPTLLLIRSPDLGPQGLRRMAGSASIEPDRQRPSAGTGTAPPPDPSRHSMVCCCLLCEQYGTGEQAMRAAQGDYGQFLASVRSAARQADQPTTTTPTKSRKPSRQGETPMRRREPCLLLRLQSLGPRRDVAQSNFNPI